MSINTTERIVPNPATLVKFADPVVFTNEKKTQKVGTWTQKERVTSPGFPEEPEIPGLVAGASIPCEDISLNKIEVEDVLNTILPPRIWEEEGQTWKQSVSTNSATRVDVLNLQEQLTIRLKQRQARDRGICPVRRELFSQCFEELIRQVSINCVERGLLLIRIRDEIRMTLAAHKSLYESSTAFGIKNDVIPDMAKITLGRAALEEQHAAVVQGKKQLFNTIHELQIKMQQIERRYQERRDAANKMHAEETQFLKRANLQLQAQLDGILGTKKA